MGGGGKETFAMTDVTPNEARMPEDAAVTVTNADTLRAMASPIRMRILGTLRVNGEQTVGSISEQLGEAPGAISYHLGQLARVGLVEKVRSPDGDRRKSWWKACQTAVRLGNSEEKNSADKAKAMDLFRRSAALSYEMAYERFLDRLPELPREWADSCASDDHVLNLTAEETSSMIEELNEVVRRWQIKAGMHGDDELGVEPVALILQAFRWFS